jgi:5-methylcytosine-specific restriction enzyme B
LQGEPKARQNPHRLQTLRNLEMDGLIELIQTHGTQDWSKRCTAAFASLFGAQGGRYGDRARKAATPRVPEIKGETGVPFGALIHPSNPDSGPYGGMSFVVFPAPDAPCLVALCVGTQGLAPDEDILARPGHARKVGAICTWLNYRYGKGKLCAWAKRDPVRTDLDVPANIVGAFPSYGPVFERYGRVLYAIFAPTHDVLATEDATKAFLDLMFGERKHFPLKSEETDAERIRSNYFAHLMPDVQESEVVDLLKRRRYVIVEGPPGTGKTRLALRLIRQQYDKRGTSIQFHPNTTYENFVGGLAPVQSADGFGFRFAAQKGALMHAAEEALNSPSQMFLLHVDEINRADLAKILGEAIFLLEPGTNEKRYVSLAYDYGPPFGSRLSLPENLHIVGTMNSADRSIAIVDVAVRRRFAFVKLWPQMRVVDELGGPLMQQAFKELTAIFVEHASEDTFPLAPGHSYFLEKDDSRAATSLKVHLAPLLEEYLSQGYVATFSDAIRAYLQWLETLA